jgi:hypothetical protein
MRPHLISSYSLKLKTQKQHDDGCFWFLFGAAQVSDIIWNTFGRSWMRLDGC